MVNTDLRLAALKKYNGFCLAVFFVSSLVIISLSAIKYEKRTTISSENYKDSLKNFSKKESKSKLRASQWLNNGINDFGKLDEIIPYLSELSSQLHKVSSYTNDNVSEILSSPGIEYQKSAKKSKKQNSWPSNQKRRFPLDVNYDFGIFVPSNEIIEKQKYGYDKSRILEDKLRFASFINKITTLVDNQYKEESAREDKYNYSTLMKKTFGIYEESKDSFPELEVLWVYVGSDSGAFATFPANAQEFHDKSNGKPYNPTQRPWFKEAIEKRVIGDRRIFDGYENIGLSSVYDDYGEHNSSVRTLWYKLNLDIGKNIRTYVIGIDFYLNENTFSVNPPIKGEDLKLMDFVILNSLKLSLYIFVFNNNW